MTDATESAPHSHSWVSQPVTGITFDWKCQDEACGETVAYEWHPEWAQDGLERYEEDLVATRGGAVLRPVPITPAEVRARLDATPLEFLADPGMAAADAAIRSVLDSLEGAPGTSA